MGLSIIALKKENMPVILRLASNKIYTPDPAAHLVQVLNFCLQYVLLLLILTFFCSYPDSHRGSFIKDLSVMQKKAASTDAAEIDSHALLLLDQGLDLFMHVKLYVIQPAGILAT